MHTKWLQLVSLRTTFQAGTKEIVEEEKHAIPDKRRGLDRLTTIEDMPLSANDWNTIFPWLCEVTVGREATVWQSRLSVHYCQVHSFLYFARCPHLPKHRLFGAMKVPREFSVPQRRPSDTRKVRNGRTAVTSAATTCSTWRKPPVVCNKDPRPSEEQGPRPLTLNDGTGLRGLAGCANKRYDAGLFEDSLKQAREVIS